MDNQTAARIAGDDLIVLLASKLPANRRRALAAVGPHDIDDVMQDAALAIVLRVREGVAITNAAGYVARIVTVMIWELFMARTAARQRDGGSVPAESLRDRRLNPEEALLEREKDWVARRGLTLIRPDAAEVVERTVFAGEAEDPVMADMGVNRKRLRKLKVIGKLQLITAGRDIASRSGYLTPEKKAA